MFGMLDYRAHRLWLILCQPWIFLLGLAMTFLLPCAAFVISLNFTHEFIWLVLISIVALFLIEIPSVLIVKAILWFLRKIFWLLIDIVPGDGRTKEDAEIVAYLGDTGLLLLETRKPISEWTEDFIHRYATFDIYNRMFAHKIKERVYALQRYYAENPEVVESAYRSTEHLKKEHLAIGWLEKIITDPTLRPLAIRYMLLGLLLIFRPFG
jgi:hypothetical protein